MRGAAGPAGAANRDAQQVAQAHAHHHRGRRGDERRQVRAGQHGREHGAELGVALCGSGIGIAIAVNRHPGCRCALVSEPLSATLARSHNDANVLAMGARLIGPEMAEACLAAFLDTPFLGGRHASRVDQLHRPVLETTS